MAVADGLDICVLVADKQEPVCCYGCKAVYELISAGGLDNYYQFRTAYADKAEETTQVYADFDHPAFQQAFCDSPRDKGSQHRHASLIIEGIHCAACIWLLEKSCAQLPGVVHFSVSLVDGSAKLEWNTAQLKLSSFARHIHALGFKPFPWSQNNKDLIQEKTEKQMLKRVGLAGIMMMQVGMLSIGLYAGEFYGMETQYRNLLQWFAALLTTPVLFYSAQSFFSGAWRSIKKLSVNMDVPVVAAMSIAWFASIAALLNGSGKIYFDSICMFVFLLLGVRYLDIRARNRYSRLRFVNDIPPNCKKVLAEDSVEYELVPVHTVTPGDLLMIHSGELVPVDGILLGNSAILNEASISGEFLPREKSKGNKVLSGTINTAHAFVMQADKPAEHSSLQLIQKLALQAQQRKPDFLQLSDKVARYFSFGVILATCLAASFWFVFDSSRILDSSIAMLIVSCPCALSLAAPSAIAVATNFLRQQGALVCDANFLEKLNRVTRVIFDKTGTLTQGKFSIQKTHILDSKSKNKSDLGILSIAAGLESWSEHPIARAFNSTGGAVPAFHDVTTRTNAGVSGFLHDTEYRIGSAAFCSELAPSPAPTVKTAKHSQCIWLVNSSDWLACFELQDSLRSGARQAINALSHFKPSLLSGDSSSAVDYICEKLGLYESRSGCSPADKLEHISNLQAQGDVSMMVGDGINDLPVLAQADVSVAMNSASELAQTQADCILLSNKIELVPILFNHARATYKIIRQNIGWALLYNFSALPLAAAGLIPPWAAALGMSASSLVVILNASKLHKAI